MTPAQRITHKLTEAQVTQQVKAFLESRGWTGFRLQAGLVRGFTGNAFMRLAKKGTPDWVFVRAREALFVEMKKPGAGLSLDQRHWFEWAELSGIQRICADGLDEFMRRYGKIFTR